jgi:hypothetical protein
VLKKPNYAQKVMYSDCKQPVHAPVTLITHHVPSLPAYLLWLLPENQHIWDYQLYITLFATADAVTEPIGWILHYVDTIQ